VLGQARLVAFLAATDLDRTRAFLGRLGLTEVAADPYGAVFDGNGTPVRVNAVESLEPRPFTVLGWEVADLDGVLAGLDVTPLRYDGMDQDDRGIWTAPGGARIAWFHDPDGNVLSLTQPSPARSA
jgi:hypothetical protein